eukprot:3182061-Rhodomonas_salina.2
MPYSTAHALARLQSTVNQYHACHRSVARTKRYASTEDAVADCLSVLVARIRGQYRTWHGYEYIRMQYRLS